jgi:hypothetical protein
MNQCPKRRLRSHARLALQKKLLLRYNFFVCLVFFQCQLNQLKVILYFFLNIGYSQRKQQLKRKEKQKVIKKQRRKRKHLRNQHRKIPSVMSLFLTYKWAVFLVLKNIHQQTGTTINYFLTHKLTPPLTHQDIQHTPKRKEDYFAKIL